MPITPYRRKTYPIVPSEARHLRRLGRIVGLLPGRVHRVDTGEPGHRLEVRAIYTGEKREPKAGEWYLSGAIAEAYHTPADLSTAYHIARLVVVRVRMVETLELVPAAENNNRAAD